MADEKPKSKVVAGCAGMMLKFFFVLPLWLSLLFGILVEIHAPTWMWVSYWIYLPSCFLAGIAQELAGLLDE